MKLLELCPVLATDEIMDIELERTFNGKTFTCVESYIEFPAEYIMHDVKEIYTDDNGVLTIKIEY